MSIVNNIKDNDLQNFKVDNEIIVDKNVIGEFIKDTAELIIFNENHQYDILDKTYINITNFGEWFVEEIANDEENESLTLKLCDKSKEFDNDYEDTFSFPATMKEWATWIGNKVGIPLKGSFLNENLVLSEKPYMGNNPKWRTAIKVIAKYASSWADMNNDDTYSIKWFEDKVHEIDDWESFNHGITTKPTNIIILSTGVTEDNVRWPETIPAEPHELRIEDDWTNINRYDINEAIYNQVNGFFYTTISNLTLLYGIFDLIPGQKIRAKDIELNDIETFISSHNLSWDGGDWNDPKAWTSKIKMLDLKETTTKYQYSNSIEDRVGRTEINCDKNKKRIEMIVEDIDTIEKDITTSKTASSNPIEITDAGEYPLESIGIDSKSEQKTYKGNQLLDFSKLINGTSASHTFENDILTISSNGGFREVYIDITDIIKSNSSKTLYFNCESFDYSKGKECNTHLKIIKSDGKVSYSVLFDKDGNKIPYSIPNDSSTITQIILRFIANNTANSGDYSASWSKPILSFEDNAEYESYAGGTPSPNPNYPQEIKTVKGVTNYFDKDVEILNKYVAADGTLANALNFNNALFNKHILVEPNKDYTLSINKKIQALVVSLFDKNDKIISRIVKSSDINTFTTTDDTKYILVVINIDNETTITREYIDNLDIMLEEGPIAHDYVPYGTWLKQKNIEENKFDKNSSDIIPNYRLDDKGNIVSSTVSSISEYIKILENDEYIISFDYGRPYDFRICFYDNDKVFLSGVEKLSLLDTCSVVTPPNAKYLRFNFPTTCIDTTQIYKENTALIDMNIYDENGNIVGHHEFAELNDIKDNFLDSDLTKKTGKVVLTGDENLVSNNNQTLYGIEVADIIYVNSTSVKANLLSSHFISGSVKESVTNANIVSSYQKIIWFNTLEKSLSDFKVWLKEQYNAGNPVIVYYVLEEPQTYQLNYEPLKLHKGYNYITLNDELMPNMNIKYLTDSKFNDFATKEEVKAELEIESGRINLLAEKTDANSDDIAQLEIKTDEINQKVSNLADVTKEEISDKGSVSFDKVNESEPLVIEIHPTTEDISYLYLLNENNRDGPLYLSDDLFLLSRDLIFKNLDTGEELKYTLPTDLNIFDGVYDEFILNYQEKICKVIKRIGIDESGNKYKLSKEKPINCEYQHIQLKNGNYEIYLLSFNDAYLKVRLMIQNEFTSQFATQAYVEASVKTTKDEVLISAKEELVSKDEVIKEINNSLRVGTDAIEFIGNKLIVDTTNFKLNEKEAKFSGDIYLGNEGILVGGKGLLTTMTIEGTLTTDSILGSTIMAPFGFSPRGEVGVKDRIDFDFIIPKSFTIQSAYIIIHHKATYTTFYDNSLTTVTGYTRNIKAYRATSFSNNYYSVNWDSYMGLDVLNDLNTYDEIHNAFGSNGFTGSPTGYSQGKSSNIKDYISTSVTNDTRNLIRLQSSASTPSGLSNIYAYTGACKATLVITGYTKFER